MTALPLIDPSLCAVCGQPNRCAMETQKTTGLEQQPCWCTHVDFSRDLLARIPPDFQGLACICASCAAGAGPR